MNHSPSKNQYSSLIYMLATLVAMGALAIDMYLPSIPEVATHFATSIPKIELTISMFLVGFAFGQFTGGPFSDHYGRKPMMMIGLSIFTVASIGMVFSPSLPVLYGFRILQGFGGGFTTVNCAPLVKDRFNHQESAKILSTIAGVRMAVPIIAPIIGGLLVKLGYWQTSFVVLFLYALGALLMVNKKIEQLPSNKQGGIRIKPMLQNYGHIFSNRQGMGFILSGAFTLCGLYAFISRATSIYVSHFHIAETIFPWLFALNTILMLGLSRYSKRLLRKRSPESIVRIGYLMNFSAGALLWLYVQFTPQPSLWVLMLLGFLFIGALGFVFGHVNACFLQCYPGRTATANATYGLIRFSMAGTIGGLIHFISSDILLPTYQMMFLCAILSNGFYYLLAFQQPQPAAS